MSHSYLFTVTLSIYARSYEMLDLLEVLKNAMQVCEKLEGAPDLKTKTLLPS